MNKSIVSKLSVAVLDVEDLSIVVGAAGGASTPRPPGAWVSGGTSPAGSRAGSGPVTPTGATTPLNFDGVSPGTGRAYDTFGFTRSTDATRPGPNGTTYADTSTQTHGNGRRHSAP
jgi:hypothetical protein